MPKKKSDKPKEISSYTLLNRWLYDGSRTSIVPDSVLNDYKMGPQYVLYFFRGSHYLPYISNTFNNFGIFQMDKTEVFKMIKDIVMRTGFKPKFYRTASKSKIKLVEALRKKFPFLKVNDIRLLSEKIDESEMKETIYHTLGISKGSSKKRTTKKQLEQIKQQMVDTPDVVDDYEDNVMEVDAAEAIRQMEDIGFEGCVTFKELVTEMFTIEE